MVTPVPYYVQILNPRGVEVGTLNGYEVAGPAKGIRTLSYHPQGGIIDNIGKLQFEVPTSDRANLPLDVGNEIKVFERGANGYYEAAWGIINQRSETLSKDGQFAQFTCEDVLGELRRISATSGVVAENISTTNILQLLTGFAAYNGQPAWTGVNTVTTLDGIAFSAYGKSAIAAIDKLRTERFCHFKRGVGRTVVFGRTDDPTTDWQNSGLTLVHGAPDPIKAQQYTEMRPIEQVQRQRDANIVNDVVPLGGGTGILQLTLQPLYGNTTFTGYDPTHLIQRRPRADGGGYDGYDYYLQETASISGSPTTPAYGLWMGDPKVFSDITSISNLATDVTQAAVSLYSAGVAWLKYNAYPSETLTLTVPGYGDVRGVGGKRVHVRDYQWVSGVQTFALDSDYIVTEWQRAWSAGVATDTVTVNNLGTASRTTAAIIGGILTNTPDVAIVPQEFVNEFQFPFADNVDTGFPLSWTCYGNGGIKRYFQFTVIVTPSAYRVSSDMLNHIHDTAINGMVHDVGNNGAVTHDMNSTTHDLNAQPLDFRVGGIDKGSNVDYDPGTKVHINSGSPPSNAKTLVTDGSGFWTVDGSFGGKDLPTSSLHLGIGPTPNAQTTNATSGGTGGKTTATSGGTGGKVTPTTGGTGGKVVNATKTSGTHYNGQNGLTAGPEPTGLTLVVNGQQVAGPSNGVFSVDLIQAGVISNPASNYTIEVHAASVGRVTMDVIVRRSQSSIA